MHICIKIQIGENKMKIIKKIGMLLLLTMLVISAFSMTASADVEEEKNIKENVNEESMVYCNGDWYIFHCIHMWAYITSDFGFPC